MVEVPFISGSGMEYLTYAILALTLIEITLILLGFRAVLKLIAQASVGLDQNWEPVREKLVETLEDLEPTEGTSFFEKLAADWITEQMRGPIVEVPRDQSGKFIENNT